MKKTFPKQTNWFSLPSLFTVRKYSYQQEIPSGIYGTLNPFCCITSFSRSLRRITMHVYGAFCIHYRRKVKNTSIGSNHDICHEFSARPYSFQDRIGHGIGPSLRRMIQHYLEPGDKNTITSSAVRSGIYMKLCYVKITSRLHIFGHTLPKQRLTCFP